ncbi:universal stress protein [bacterium]|nr:universal stress protein [bacterium]
MITLKKILVPIDFSSISKLSLRYAASFAAEFGSKIHVLHVVEEEVLQPGTLEDPLNTRVEWETEEMQKLHEFIDPDLLEWDIEKAVIGGLAFEGIIDYAKTHEIDLIIMGARGVSGYLDSWLGGTAYEVARKASCPVLTVKPNGIQ